MITRIVLENFKSFKHLDIDLDRFNILIGANASGKSNFISVFKFIRDIMEYGLEDGISMQGGMDCLFALNPSNPKEKGGDFLTLKLFYNVDIVVSSGEPFKQYESKTERTESIFHANKMEYEFSISRSKNRAGFNIESESLRADGTFDINKYKTTGKIRIRKTFISGDSGKGSVLFTRSTGRKKVKCEIKSSTRAPVNVWDFFEFVVVSENISNRKYSNYDLFPRMAPFAFFGNETFNPIRNMAIYDFDPRLAKKAQYVSGRSQLAEDGSNLTTVLNRILRSSVETKKLYGVIQRLLPFIKAIKIEKEAGSFLLTLRDDLASDSTFIPSRMLSDGTIYLTAMSVALFFGDSNITIIEEPERSIHPSLIFKFIDMARDASRKSQIILTTHSPELVKHAKPHELMLITRNENGSCIVRPLENAQIQVFLENQMGVDELYIQNLLYP